MEIEDIQHDEKTGFTEIRFCDDQLQTVLRVNISKRDIWMIHDFCQNELSYGAQLKRQRLGAKTK